MAREYFYCARCQTRLSDVDVQDGKAIEIRGQVSCERCLSEVMAPLSLKEQEEILLHLRTAKEERALLRRPSSPANPVPPPRPLSGAAYRAVRSPSGERPAVRPAAAASSGHWGLVVFVGLAVLLVALGGLLWYADSTRPPLPPSPPVAAGTTTTPAVRPPSPSPTPPAASAPAGSAQEAVDRARASVQAHPDDLAGQVDAHQKAALVADGTPLAEAARKALEDLRAAHRERIAKELAEVDLEIRPFVEKEEFKKAGDRLEELRGRHAVAAWSQGVDVRIRDVGTAAWKAFTPLRDRALDAGRRKADAELREVKDRIAKWGLPTFLAELDGLLAGLESGDAKPPPVPPPSGGELKPLSAELKAYRAEWLKAVALAAARDFEAAAVLAGRAGERLSEEDAKAEARSDLEILGRVRAVHRAAADAVAAWPLGERIPLEVLDEALNPEKIFEPFLRATRESVEVMRQGMPVSIELAELTARSVGELYRTGAAKESDGGRRAAALACLLEGDSDGARAFLAGPPDQIPWKYWQEAARRSEARADPKEVEARKLYFAAEANFQTPRTRAAAIAAYRLLLNDHAASAVVQRRRARITERRDSGKEYLFFGEDLAAAGTFKADRHAKAGPCWVSEADSPPAKGRDNYVEVQFYALPEATYRCWAYVGGCCQETFAFYYQTSDLTVLDPATKENLLVEPGGNASLPVKHSITFLKSRHESHGGPKEPKRWEWVAVPLPKYAAGGLKIVRLMTEQKGFGAAIVVVSASRSGPPLESEVKAWIRPREEVPPEPGPAAPPAERDPSLVGHWKMDGSGPTEVDSSGRDNTAILVGEPERTDGRIGKGLVLDGKDRYANIPGSGTLDRVQEGSYTVAAWFKPHSKPAGAEAAENNAYFAIVMKSGVHEGLKYGADQKFAMDHWLSDGTGAAAVSGSAFPPGSYHHVAGVVSRPEGTVRIYVNGRLEGTHSWNPKTAPRDFGSSTWKIGIGAPGAAEYRWAADGTVDDVRIYNRALPANEIKLLAAGALGPAPGILLASPAPGAAFLDQETVTLVASPTVPDRIQRVDFLIGSTLLGSTTKAPFTYSWQRVPSGYYTATARGTDKSGALIWSAPVSFRVGNTILYRAVNLGGPQTSIDGVPYEAKGGKWLRANGIASERKDVDLSPSADGARAVLIRSSVAAREGTAVALENVPNGTYQVYLWVWEDNEAQTYDVCLEEKVVQAKYQSGPAGTWAKLGPWAIDLTDGELNLAAKGGTACFSGVEVWRVTR